MKSEYGDIEVYVNSGTPYVIGHVEAKDGQTTQAFYSIRSGYRGQLYKPHPFVSSSKEADIFIWARYNANTLTPSRRIILQMPGVSKEASPRREFPQGFPEYTDIFASSFMSVGTGWVTTTFDVMETKNGH